MDPNELILASYVRHLRVHRRSPRTIQSYEEALTQLAAHHDGADLTKLDREAIEDYLLAVMERYKPTTAANRYRSLRAFYRWLVAEEFIDRSPMERMRPPKVPDEPVRVLSDDELRALLATCRGSDFESRRDLAIIRLWCEPGSPRRAEMAALTVDDVDLRHDQITVRGKGDRVRVIPFGAKTGQALDRYLRVRARHPYAHLPPLWLGSRGRNPAAGLGPTGLRLMLAKRAAQAGLGLVRPHQLRHTAAHHWADLGGSEQDAMVLFGWRSPDMPRRYGRSAQVERAQRAARRLSPADRL